MEAFMMITALAWPIIGGVVTGLVAGLVRGHGLVGTIVDMIAAGLAGFALTAAFIAFGHMLPLPESLGVPLSLGLPVVGGLIGLWIKGLFTR